MNMNDIARLKWKDIDEINGKKFFTFYRGIKRSENQPKIKVNISNLMWFIINRNRGNEKYLFNMLNHLFKIVIFLLGTSPRLGIP